MMFTCDLDTMLLPDPLIFLSFGMRKKQQGMVSLMQTKSSLHLHIFASILILNMNLLDGNYITHVRISPVRSWEVN